MNRDEFIERLQRTLAGGLNSYQVADNVRYYREYIDGEIRKGVPEEEVLSMLGDPRLLGKSIIEANKRTGASEGRGGIYDEEAVDESQVVDAYEEQEVRKKRLSGWWILILVLLLLLLAAVAVFSLLGPFAVVLIVIVAADRIKKHRQ